MVTTAADSPAPPWRSWLWPAILVLAVALAYANALPAPFVYDDTLAIPENPTIRSLWRLDRVLAPEVAGGVTVAGRPMLNLSFAINYAISGHAPWSYHVGNAAIHAGAALLLFGIVRRTRHAWRGRRGPAAGGAPNNGCAGTDDGIALAVAALWALHPLQTQAVTYVVQRAESLMGFFYLLTLYSFVRAATGGRAARNWGILCIAAGAAGMATKEVMVTAPVLVFLFDRTFLAGSFREAWRRRWALHSGLAATWLVLVALLAATGGNRGGTIGLGTGVPLWAYPLTQFAALSRYLALSVWPHPLVFEYGTAWVKQAREVWPFAAVIVPLLGATLVAVWRRPIAGFFGAWFFGILAPTSLAPGTIQMIVEHRMYLPLAALVAGAVLTITWALPPAARRTMAWAWPAIALACLVLTVRRNHDYRSNLALWHDTVAKRPLNPRAYEGLAEALAAAGRFEEAITVRERSVALLPDESHYHFNLAVTLANAGRPEHAVESYRRALALVPNEGRTHNNLAILLARLGRNTEALPHYREAVRLQPDEPLYHYNHGIAQMRDKQWAAAAASFSRAAELQPAHADAFYNLGAARLRLGRPAEAVQAYAKAAELKPGDAAYAIGHGNALVLVGRLPLALAEFERAIAADRGSLEARLGAGSTLAALRRPAEAVGHYEAALGAAPDNAALRFKLGNALLDLDRIADAITHYEAAVRLAPHDAEAWHNLGVAFARQERWDDAGRSFDEALRLKPDYADARRSRAQLRQVTGR